MSAWKPNYKNKSAALFWLIGWCCLVMASSSIHAANLQQVRVSASADSTRVVFDLSDEVKYTYFTLYDNEPKRIVIDFQNTKNQTDLTQIQSQSLLLKRIRPSSPPQPSTFRVVLEVNQEVQPAISTLGPSGNAKHRLVVDLAGKSLATRAVETRQTQQNQLRPVIIVVDAGHGGGDPGSIGPTGIYEKQVTLGIAQRLAKLIQGDPTMRVILTRSTDARLSLEDRAVITRNAHADLFISIHADAFHTPQPSGASVWVLSRRRSETEFGRALEDKERLSEELFGLDGVLEYNQDDYLTRALLDMRRDDSMLDGTFAAEAILKYLGHITDLHKSVPQGGSLAVLSNLGTPSVLIEVGFISNYKKEKLLKTASYQQKLAQAIYQGLKEHFTQSPIDGTLIANQVIHTYTVVRGDSLSKIAGRYGTSVDAIMQYNQLKSSNIHIGQKLHIPSH